MPKFIIGTTSVYDYHTKGEDPLIILALHQEIQTPNAKKGEVASEEEAIKKLEAALLRLLTPYLLNKPENQQKDLVAWAKNHLSYYMIERTPIIGNNDAEVIAVLKQGVEDAHSSILAVQNQTTLQSRGIIPTDDFPSHRSIIHTKSTRRSTEVEKVLLISPCNLGYPHSKYFPLENPDTIYDVMKPFRIGGTKGPLPPTKCVWTAESIAIRNAANRAYAKLQPKLTNARAVSLQATRTQGIKHSFYAPLEIKSLMGYLDDWWMKGLNPEDQQISEEKSTRRKKSLTELIHPTKSSEKYTTLEMPSKRHSLMNFISRRFSDSSESSERTRATSLPTHFDENSVSSNHSSRSLSRLKNAVLRRLGSAKQILPVNNLPDDDSSLDNTTISSKRDSTSSSRKSSGSRRDRVSPLTTDEHSKLQDIYDDQQFEILWRETPLDNISEASEDSQDYITDDEEKADDDSDGKESAFHR